LAVTQQLLAREDARGLERMNVRKKKCWRKICVAVVIMGPTR
jgi:hypothetical protein